MVSEDGRQRRTIFDLFSRLLICDRRDYRVVREPRPHYGASIMKCSEGLTDRRLVFYCYAPDDENML